MARTTDVLIRAMTDDGGIRALAVNSTRLCEHARRVQGAWPAAAAALGRLLSAAVMMGATIKEGERISLRVESEGPLERLFAQATPDGRVRGFVRNPEVNPPSRGGKLDVGRAVGPGTLYVIRELGMGEPYVGQVPLQTGEIGDDLAYYFAVSEQLPSAVGLGVLVEPSHKVVAAGGYILQLLPGANEAVIARLEENIRRAPKPSDLILSLRDPEQVIGVLLEGFAWHVLERASPRFHCGCTRGKSRAALRILNAVDLREMIAEDHPARVSCDFCGRAYEFSPAELAKVLEEKKKG